MATDTGAKFSSATYISLTEVGVQTTKDETQITPIVTATILADNVYGQIVALSGINFSGVAIQTTNISGVGDIIYYGPSADIIMDDGELSAFFGDHAIFSGLAMTTGDYSSLSISNSNSLVVAVESGVAVLPDASQNEGVYFYFANPLGVDFSVSGVNTIKSASVDGQLATFSGVSHLGLISDGGKWVATEEQGII